MQNQLVVMVIISYQNGMIANKIGVGEITSTG